MAVPALNSDEILALKKLAKLCRMSMADLVRIILREQIEDKHETPHRITVEVEEADPEESAEILALIDNMTEDDHEIVRVHKLCCPV